MSGERERVVVLGASDNPERYSNKAVRMLREYGHEVVPVHHRLNEVEGIPVVGALSGVEGVVDTVTVYVNPGILAGLADDLVGLKPKRVIFNPGTESAAVEEALRGAGIETEQACTLVLLTTGQY